MKTKLIIRGAIYYDNESDTILIPHFTGEFFMVDCTEYKKIQDIKDSYTKEFFIENKNNYIVYEGNKYFYAEYSPCYIDDNWFLLSDLSNLEFNEETNEF